MDEDTWVARLASARWQYAGTMPTWPHIYTVREWWPPEEEFALACEFIETAGHVIPWPPPPVIAVSRNRYFVLGELKFWAMGPLGDQDEPSARTVLNSAVADPSERDSCASEEMLNHIGAWSDLSTRLVSLIQTGSRDGSSAGSRSTPVAGT